MSEKFEISHILGIPDSVEIPECLAQLKFLPQADFIARAFEIELNAKRTAEAVHDCLNAVMNAIGITSQSQGIIELKSSDFLTCSFVDSYKVDKNLLKESPYYSRVLKFVLNDKKIGDRLAISRKDLELYLKAYPSSSLDISEVLYSTGYYKIIKTKNGEESV